MVPSSVSMRRLPEGVEGSTVPVPNREPGGPCCSAEGGGRRAARSPGSQICRRAATLDFAFLSIVSGFSAQEHPDLQSKSTFIIWVFSRQICDLSIHSEQFN